MSTLHLTNGGARCASLGLLMLLASTESAHAQLWGSLPPTAPILRLPNGATIAAGQLGESVDPDRDRLLLDARPTLFWRHGSFSLTWPRPATPTHFAVCVYDPAVTLACAVPTATWTIPVGTIPSTPASPYTGGQINQYDYTFTAPSDLSDTLRDKTVRWAVGACVLGTSSICTFSAPRDLWLSTRNLVSRKVLLDDSRGHTLVVNHRVQNKGTTDSGAFVTETHLWNVLMTQGEACQRDPNHSQVAANDVVITRTGDLVAVSSLPLDSSGRRIAPAAGIQAIYRPGSWATSPIFEFVPNVPAAPVAYTFGPRTGSSPGSIPVPAAYAARVVLDTGRAVREFNESDNVGTECHVVHDF